MAHVAERPDTYAPHVEALLAGPDAGAGWLRDARQAAFARFQARGLPTTRDEEWRFTPIAPIASTPFAPAPAVDTPAPASLAPFQFDGAGLQVVLVNGRLDRDLSVSGPLPAGVSIRSIGSDAAAFGAAALATATPAADIATTAFADLNLALLPDAVVIDIAPGAAVAEPIFVLGVTVSDGGPVVASPRVIIRVGERAEVSIVESWTSLGGAPAFTNAVTQIAAGPAAIVNHVKLQREPAAAFHLASALLRLDRSATVRSCAITLGGRIARNDVIATLAGEGAEVTLDGVYVGDGESLIDTHTTIDHAEPHCPSHEVYKGILAGRARAVFNGKIIVRQKAQKTDAKQTNKALLLTDEAQVNTKPQLEIFADDVKCTHGAAIGQLDEDALFYLRARGVGADEARNMLIHAFAGEVLDRVGLETVSARALTLIDQKLKLG
jgi:Fe-S cluster assembly protein SufD